MALKRGAKWCLTSHDYSECMARRVAFAPLYTATGRRRPGDARHLGLNQSTSRRHHPERTSQCATHGVEPRQRPLLCDSRSGTELAVVARAGRRPAACRPPGGDTRRHLIVSTRAMTAPTPPPTAMTAAGLNSCAAAPAATKAAPWPTITPMLARPKA